MLKHLGTYLDKIVESYLTEFVTFVYLHFIVSNAWWTSFTTLCCSVNAPTCPTTPLLLTTPIAYHR